MSLAFLEGERFPYPEQRAAVAWPPDRCPTQFAKVDCREDPRRASRNRAVSHESPSLSVVARSRERDARVCAAMLNMCQRCLPKKGASATFTSARFPMASSWDGPV